jgi:uncharacterized protein
MLGTLTDNQCRHILICNHVGRIGFTDDDRVSIIPVTYVSDGDNIYSHALEGSKISAMRKHQEVCFQIDNIDNLANWRSIIVWGKFEEVRSMAAQTKVRTLFQERLEPIIQGETVSPDREIANPPERVQKRQHPIIYKIIIKELAGRFEKS